MIAIGDKTYDVKFVGNQYAVARRMPPSAFLRFVCATKDFFARGFSMETRASAYTSYLNARPVTPCENPVSASIAEIAPSQSGLSAPASALVTPSSHKPALVAAPKSLTTLLEDSVAVAANRIFDALNAQDGRIGITMSSTQATFQAYENRSLAQQLPDKFDGRQAHILRELRQKCVDAGRGDLLERIYVVPFACDANTPMEVTDQNIQYAQSFVDGENSTLFVWGVPGRELAIGGGQHTRDFPLTENYGKIKAALIPSGTPAVAADKYSVGEIDDWLFKGKQDKRFPLSKLHGRMPENYRPKQDFSSVPLCSTGKYAGRFGIHNGGITDLRASGARTAICTSNNGDLLTGCGYAVAKAVVNAAGPALQAELYNKYGVPGVMEVPEYGKQEKYAVSEGRGYALTCGSYDMAESHGVGAIELLTVPMHDRKGVLNMYKEAFKHSQHMDYIAVPMAGMTHPVLNGNSALSAELATAAAKEFIDENPDSRLKIIFVIFNDPVASENYRKQIAA